LKIVSQQDLGLVKTRILSQNSVCGHCHSTQNMPVSWSQVLELEKWRYSLLEAVFSLFQLQKYEGRLYLHTFLESESWNWKVRIYLSSYFSSSSTIGHEKTLIFSVHSPRILFNLKMSFLDEVTDSRNWI